MPRKNARPAAKKAAKMKAHVPSPSKWHQAGSLQHAAINMAVGHALLAVGLDTIRASEFFGTNQGVGHDW